VSGLTAVVLVGGEGTRLRPLTERTPKPMLPLGDRPLLAWTFDHLRSHGVDRIVLSCGYLPTAIEAHFGEQAEYRVEPEPLGTAGAIRFGADGIRETFVAVNGDTLRGADLSALVAFHRERGAEATILLEPVEDPSRYGLVRVAEDGRVREFLEKPRPEEIDTNLINAGVYVLEPSVLDLIEPGRAVSIEREIFPQLVARGSCYGLATGGYWLDIGTP
jgi:mannose-1-phosphate guanylyltransferase